jgi:molecular chaperone GrpE
MSKVRIPVRVVKPPVTPRRTSIPELDLARSTAKPPTGARQQAKETAPKAVSSSADKGPVENDRRDSGNGNGASAAVQAAVSGAMSEAAERNERERSYRSSEVDEWRERALRLQAEMANYRRRQQRIAREEVRAEKAALLRDVLAIADNLDRALSAAREPSQNPARVARLIEGVELTRSSLERTLDKYGLERIQAEGEPFDPARHEAVHVVPALSMGVAPGTVVQVLEAGYRDQDALVRPAKVVVSQ